MTFTIISIPPVVALHLNAMPIPTAIRAPPNTAPRIGSVVAAPLAANQLENPEISTISYIVDAINFPPNFQKPRIRIGIFNRKNNVPISSGISRFKEIHKPDTPPGAKLFASIKDDTPQL